MQMGFGAGSPSCMAGDVDPILVVGGTQIAPWHKIISLLRVPPAENRYGIQLERNELTVIIYAFEKYGENSKHKEDRVGWF